MKTVIDKTSLQRHTVDKYKFKVLTVGAAHEREEERRSIFEEGSETPSAVAAGQGIVAEPAAEAPGIASGSRDELVESLLKKADEMSSSVIKMQMKLEEAEAAYKEALETERAKAFEEGRQAALKEAETAGAAAQREALERFAASVATLENRAEGFNQALESVKNDLVHAAVDIAKEVVLVEIGERSGAIAQKLASELIAELQDASRVTLRVNPADHGAISEAVGSLERIEVISDSAVSRGGVIATSDSGNIDAEVMKRFERVKNAALAG